MAHCYISEEDDKALIGAARYLATQKELAYQDAFNQLRAAIPQTVKDGVIHAALRDAAADVSGKPPASMKYSQAQKDIIANLKEVQGNLAINPSPELSAKAASLRAQFDQMEQERLSNRSPRAKDQTLTDLRIERAKAQQRFSQIEQEASLGKAGRFTKGTYDWSRFAKLSGVGTLAKIAEYDAGVLMSAPLERAAGQPFTKFIKGSDPLTSFASELEMIKGTFSPEAKADAASMMKNGMTRLMADYGVGAGGEMAPHGTGTLELPARIHGAEKAFIQRGEFQRVQTLLNEQVTKAGGDPNDPMTAQIIAGKAMKSALEATLMSKPEGQIARFIQDIGKTKSPAMNYLVKTLKGFTTVATNYTGRIYRSTPLGLIHSFADAIVYNKSGEISPESATRIARNLGRGAVGSAVFAIGYTLVDPDDVPPYLIHTPLGAMLKLGGLFRRGMDIAARHGQDTVGQVYSGAANAGGEMLRAAPMAIPVEQLHDMFSGSRGYTPIEKLGKGVGNIVSGATIPQLVQQPAKAVDQGNISPIAALLTGARDEHSYRQARGFREQVETGLPWLRETLARKPLHNAQ